MRPEKLDPRLGESGGLLTLGEGEPCLGRPPAFREEEEEPRGGEEEEVHSEGRPDVKRPQYAKRFLYLFIADSPFQTSQFRQLRRGITSTARKQSVPSLTRWKGGRSRDC